MIILAIDTSCDETSIAVLQNRRVLSSVVSSQVELHKKWGGVVPDIARRAHKENIDKVYKEAVRRARIDEKDIDYVAVTIGPGLAIALEVGVDYAKALSNRLKKPFVPVNHMAGHLFASTAINLAGKNHAGLENDMDIFPILALLVSGNHTEIVYSKAYGKYEILGETLDDACGEAFDKVARVLDLGYPGGPVITYLADQYVKDIQNGRINDNVENLDMSLPIPMEKSGDLNFSFSGLKTACLYKVKSIKENIEIINKNARKKLKQSDWVKRFCHVFIKVTIKSLEIKLVKAIKIKIDAHTLVVGGGVINNHYIVRRLSRLAKDNGLFFLAPQKRFRSDNAGMIGLAAYYQIKYGNEFIDFKALSSVDRIPNLRLDV